jgi:ABC-type branched-subunit amino acid transport system ATPase component/ABC-type branched-subunit amino acid transport system permease subunit
MLDQFLRHTFFVGHFAIPVPIVVLGLITGMTYGLLAVGLVVVFRTNRIINFAHGQIGAFAAVAFGVLVIRGHVPYWVGLPLGLAVGGLTSAAVEIAVIRRLRGAPRVMSIVATLGAAQILFGGQFLLNPQGQAGSLFPQPPGMPQFSVGALLVTPAYSGMLFITPVVVVGLAVFLRWSRFGRALRAASVNPDAARLSGVYASRMSTLAWMIAGGLSAFTAILLLPTQGSASEAFGPGLVLRALSAAVVARMVNLPVALVAGLAIGVVEQLALWNYSSTSAVDLFLFIFILVGLLVQPRFAARSEEKGSWVSVQGWRPLPEAYKRVWMLRNLNRIVAAGLLAFALLLPTFISFSQAFALSTIFAVAIAGLSLGVITGLTGQLSLGQFAIAAVGGWAAWYTADQTGNYLFAILAGGLAGAGTSVIVGLPALRIKGLMLAATTLAFAFMMEGWLLRQPWALGEGVNPGRPVIVAWQLDTKGYYYFSLAFLVFALWLASNVRRGGLGRIFVALRDNHEGARAFAVSATGRSLQAFAIAGFLAGIAGGVYVHALARFSFATFSPDLSISLVAMAVLGGLGLLAGPVIGALYVFGLPDLIGSNFDAVALAGLTVGWLVLVLYVPGGLAGLLAPLRDRLADNLARFAGIDVAAARRDPVAAIGNGGGGVRPTVRLEALQTSAGDRRIGDPLLVVDAVSKRYGGVVAVDGVSLQVAEGEIVGLIGPNGAGKTTLFELISGFVRPDTGRITFAGHLLSHTVYSSGRLRLQRNLTPEARARRGLIRSFQDAALFPTMTVLEVVQLALERSSPTQLFPALIGATVGDLPKLERARELVSMMGLDAYRFKQIRELSTGTRRIVEITCLIALKPRLLLLDEPSSGIAQRETEALGVLLHQLRAQLQTTLLVIEHDIPLIMTLAERIVAMDSGRMIASGSAREIRENPLVVESYLGGDISALGRSDGVVTAAPDRLTGAGAFPSPT